MFSDAQKVDLAKPLLQSNVKQRTQSGRGLSYIESWWAISEANRIFGFDGWNRETVEIRMVAEREREIGARKEPGWSVSYIGKVRVTVGGIVREGCGAGHGIDRDLGQAHESALKEMESDAAKRALMTFGNQFGLALYDKSQENVEDDTRKPHSTADLRQAIPSGQSQPALQPTGSPQSIKKTPRQAIAEIEAINSPAALEAWEDLHKDWLVRLAGPMPAAHKQVLDALKARAELVAA